MGVVAELSPLGTHFSWACSPSISALRAGLGEARGAAEVAEVEFIHETMAELILHTKDNNTLKPPHRPTT